MKHDRNKLTIFWLLIYFSKFLKGQEIPQITKPPRPPSTLPNTWKDIVFQNLIHNYIQDCHVILTGDPRSSSLQKMTQFMFSQNIPQLLVDMNTADAESFDSSEETIFHKVIYNFPSPQCVVLINDITSDAILNSTLSFLEMVNLKIWPTIRVVFFGPNERGRETLLSSALRNTIYLLYISSKEQGTTEKKNLPPDVTIQGRCFFCDGGNEKPITINNLKLQNLYRIEENPFLDMSKNFEGHQFDIVALPWYPVTELEPLSSEPCTEALVKDSLDKRMLVEISKVLNFRYKVRLPCDGQWGTDDGNGNWSGTVGTLQNNKADFSFLLSLYHSRLKVLDYSKPYILEPVVFVALKPQPLPRSLALVRPFSGEIWVWVLSSVCIASVILRIFFKLSIAEKLDENSKKIGAVDSAFFTLSIFLLEPPISLSKHNAIRMFIAWWWIYCMIVTISYRSSLIAHLTFPSKTIALNYASELVRAKGTWTWGYEPLYGSGWTWFKDTQNPDYKNIFEGFEVKELEDQMEKVMKGNHAFFTYLFYIKAILASKYTNKFGFSPIYIAQEKYLNYGGYCWGFRKGAPFRLQIERMKFYIIEAGLIDYWMDDLIKIKAKESREEKEKGKGDDAAQKGSFTQYEETSQLVVLSLNHMQGAFYLYAVGCGVALFSLLTEIVVGKLSRSEKTSLFH